MFISVTCLTLQADIPEPTQLSPYPHISVTNSPYSVTCCDCGQYHCPLCPRESGEAGSFYEHPSLAAHVEHHTRAALEYKGRGVVTLPEGGGGGGGKK